MSSYEIKPLTDWKDINQIEIIQRETWGMTDLEMIPVRFLHSMQHNGACLMGAFDGERVIGFVFGLLGTVEGLDHRIDQVAAARLQMYSVIMGVLPEYQVSGVGFQLKLAQREFALRIGVRLVTWTFDPLESRNAHFNLVKLGVICHEYLHNFHGDLGGINAGMPTDRFFIEWWVTSNRVSSRVARKRNALPLGAFLDAGAVLINETTLNEAGYAVPPEDFKREEGNILLVEIPDSIQAIKQNDMDLAKAWREHTRQLFEYLFLSRYIVTDFSRHTDRDGVSRSYYVLTHSDS